MHETGILEDYLYTLWFGGTETILPPLLPGGIHFRYVTDADGVPRGDYPAYVPPTLIWDITEGPDTNAAGQRVLAECILTLTVIAEDMPTPDDAASIRGALDRLDSLFQSRSDLVNTGTTDDPIYWRLNWISAGKRDIAERVAGNRYLRYRGRQYRVVIASN